MKLFFRNLPVIIYLHCRVNGFGVTNIDLPGFLCHYEPRYNNSVQFFIFIFYAVFGKNYAKWFTPSLELAPPPQKIETSPQTGAKLFELHNQWWIQGGRPPYGPKFS